VTRELFTAVPLANLVSVFFFFFKKVPAFDTPLTQRYVFKQCSFSLPFLLLMMIHFFPSHSPFFSPSVALLLTHSPPSETPVPFLYFPLCIIGDDPLSPPRLSVNRLPRLPSVPRFFAPLSFSRGRKTLSYVGGLSIFSTPYKPPRLLFFLSDLIGCLPLLLSNGALPGLLPSFPKLNVAFRMLVLFFHRFLFDFPFPSLLNSFTLPSSRSWFFPPLQIALDASSLFPMVTGWFSKLHSSDLFLHDPVNYPCMPPIPTPFPSQIPPGRLLPF